MSYISLLELVPVPVSENIFLWEDVLVLEVTIFSLIVIREYFTLGGCIGVGMSNAICGSVLTPFKLGIGPMVLLGGSLQYDGFL